MWRVGAIQDLLLRLLRMSTSFPVRRSVWHPLAPVLLIAVCVLLAVAKQFVTAESAFLWLAMGMAGGYSISGSI